MVQQLGKYRIVERIGRGGMGTVYKAHDPMLDRTVALKVISTDVDITDDLRTRFFREAQACARLSHPNVVTVYDMGDENGHLYIVMEFLEGEELRQVIAQRRNVVLEDKLSMMIEVCDGLDYAHKRGIVHRDVKPGNIYVLKDGHIKVLDFGIARIANADAGLTRTGLIMGTLRYMSPEQARGRADHRSDIFSVGAVFYEFLTYRPAFPGNDPMEILERLRSEDPTPLTDVDSSMPGELGDIISRSLRKDPGARYSELSHMRVDLERLRRHLTDDADRIRARLRTRFAEITRLQGVLTERIGQSFDDETVPVVDERTPAASLAALERETAAKAERLRQVSEQAEVLHPAFEEAVGALNAGRVDEAVRGFERILVHLPDHKRAVDLLQHAHEARAVAERVRQRLTAVLREVEALLQQGQPGRGLERLQGIGEEVPVGAAEMGAEVARLREVAERALAAEQARQAEEAARQAREQARRAAEGVGAQAEAARGQAAAAQAAKYAGGQWQAAASKQEQGAAAQGREEYEAAERLFREAIREYEGAARAAREAAEAETYRVAALMGEAATLFQAGRWAEALRRVDGVLAVTPTHEAAAELRGQVHAAQETATRERERIVALLRQAEEAVHAGEAGRGLELVEGVGPLSVRGTEELGAEVERVRAAVERGLAAERSRQEAERVRQEAEQAQIAQGEAWRQAEAAGAGRYAAGQWAAAEAAGRESRAAWERGAHAESTRLSGQAVELYGRAREAARAGRQALERARGQADEVAKQAAEARSGAQKAEAGRYAAAAWGAAEARWQRATAAYEREEYEEAAQLFTAAGGEYAEAMAAVRQAAAAREEERRRAAEQARREERARQRSESPADSQPQGSLQQERGETAPHGVPVPLEVGAAGETRTAGAVATDTVRAVTPRRIPRFALGIGATTIVVIALAGYWHFSPTASRRVPAPPTTSTPTAPPPQELAPDQSEAVQALREQVMARREAAAIAGAERRAATTFEAATATERTADAAVKARDWPAARSAFRDAKSKYEAASAEAAAVLALEQKTQRAREQMTAARRAADIGGADRLAKGPWDKATDTQRLADAALKRGDLGKAEALFGESAQAYREADKVASASKAAETERAQIAAVRQKLQAAEAAAALAGTARRTAEQAAAPRYAAKTFGLAQQKEDDGRQRLDRREFESAEARLREAAKDYDAALQEAQKAAEAERQSIAARQRQEAERQAVAARQRQEAEEAAAAARRSTSEMRVRALADRDQAVKAGAEMLAKDLFASATARESEGDRLAGAQDIVAARQAYQDAAERYLEAGRRAKILQDAKVGADQARARMAAEKERAQPDAAEWNAATAQERQGTQQYQRLAFREAGESFANATALFAKAAARPPERPPERRPTPSDEVRGVLDAYVRAFETRDMSLMQKVRPGLKPEEVRRLRDAFDQSREYRVSLKVDSLNVTGDEAVVKGRREDNLVSKSGQSFRNESSFTFKLKRTSGGWVIDAVN
jgi:tetratricopeptide (TPR) repeat protein